MEFQTLKKDNKKKWIIGSIVVIALIITITYIGTRAKYKTTNSIPIAKGTIKYNYDVELVGINIQNDSGEYASSSEVPTSGYTLNKERSFCKVGNEKVNVSMEYKGKVYISTNQKGTKCELYFDKGEFKTKDLILSNNIIDNSRASGAFTEPFSEDTAGRIFSSIDDDGITYFFAGSNPNNWVKFGTNKEGQDLYWRIIRINGDNSIRIIYNGPSTSQTGESTQIKASKFSHVDAYYTSQTDNAYTSDNAYVGYMYGAAGGSIYDTTHSNTTSSAIKSTLDTWYEENLKINYGAYIDINAGFCGDRSLAAGLGFGTKTTYYGPSRRLKEMLTPMYLCPNKDNDLYTLSGSIKGNKALTNPIGLITSDDAIYAGIINKKVNSNVWLNTNQNYWTISPSLFGNAHVLRIDSYGACTDSRVDGLIGVRPVINLKSNVLTTGTGTTTDPYRIS